MALRAGRAELPLSGPLRWEGLKPGERPYRGSARFYAEYRHRPSDAFARLLAERLGWSRSERVLDLGAGPAQLSLVLAPLVGEVVAMDPEPEMLGEGRVRAAAAGIENVSFVAGGSDDLPRLGPELGMFAAGTISQAFHWMADQDAVLRALDRLVEAERGAVALVNYVKEPDVNLLWRGEPPWNVVQEILARYLVDVPPGPGPAGRHDPFPEILARSAFPQVELLTHASEVVMRPSVEAAIGFQYSLGNVLARLGRRRDAFEAEVREALADADTSPLTIRVVDSALIGQRRDAKA